MERFVTYCDLAFLDAFYQHKPDRDAAEFTEADDLWREVHRFLRKATDLYVNVSEGDLGASVRQYPFLQYFLNRPAGPRLHFDPAPFEKIETANFHRERDTPHALFLVEDTEAEHDALSRRFGAFFLSFEALVDEWARIARHQSLPVRSSSSSNRRLKSWIDWEPITPVTGLIVCDQFMFKDKSKTRRNLYPMLARLLPEEANDIPIDVTLVTREEDRNGRIIYSDLDTLKNDLDCFLENELPDLDFVISVVVARSRQRIHDRHVFTNYGFFKSGTSFNYFSKNEVVVTTELDFRPLIDSEELVIARDRIADVQRVVEDPKKKVRTKAGETTTQKMIVGKAQNKLFVVSL